jgi:putative phosphoribosyl transferase
MQKRFRDRADAGRQLAQQLATYAHHPQAIALGLPRGGVPVAYEISQILQIPLDICLVHKLGVPRDSEVAMGAIDLHGNRYLNQRIIQLLGISTPSIDRVAHSELQELQRRDRVYRGERPPVNLQDRIAIVVDDGLATGATMKAAIHAIERQQPAQIVVAIPIACGSAIEEIRTLVNLVVCLIVPEPFYAIGSWYENFSQTTDDGVCAALAASIDL